MNDSKSLHYDVKMISKAHLTSAKNDLAMVCNSRLETSSYCQFKLIRVLKIYQGNLPLKNFIVLCFSIH